MEKKIVKLNGGLGNQIFQYAFAYALSKKAGKEVLFDMDWFDEVKKHENVTTRSFDLGVFNLNCTAATQDDLNKVVVSEHRSTFKRFLGDKLKIQKFKSNGNTFLQGLAYNFDKSIFKKDFYYYDGYFQNEKYFKDFRTDLLKDFNLKENIDEKNQSVLDIINSVNSVSLHVRRGDYVTLDCAKKVHGICSLDYYAKAIKYIAKNVKNPHFFLFSDDIPWVVENLKIDYPYTVIDFNQEKGWLDLNLMKNCKHNIIANSSFSWWGAWLNETPSKIVVSPKHWTANRKKCAIVPSDWIKI